MRIRLPSIFLLLPLIATFCVIFKFQRNLHEEFVVVTTDTIPIKPPPLPIQQHPDCLCNSTKTGKIYDFCYKLPENPMKSGRRFSCEFVDYWERFENIEYLSARHDKIPEPVFITAFSSGFTSNAVRMISSIRKTGFKTKIVIYDLGLRQADLDIFQPACNVEIRPFNFSQFPPSMQNLHDYRWKSIVIAESLAEFGAIWYLDTSVIIEKRNLTHVYDLLNCQKVIDQRPPMLPISQRDLREYVEKHEDGWNQDTWKRNLEECRKSEYLLHGYSGHGIVPVTNPEVYEYFPTNFEELRKEKAKMYDAGFVYAVNTRQTMMGIVKWYVLCSLEPSCMAPKNSRLSCTFRRNNDRFSEYAKCHRFDQSIINLLLANANHYDRRYYVSEIVDFFHIKRANDFNVKNEEMQCIN